MKYLNILILLIVSIIATSEVKSQQVTNAVKPVMVADISKIESSGTFELGILFKLKPGWHIYWKNSGDSGLPTIVEFNLPENFSQTDIHWPVPESFVRSGNIKDYGYADRVLLWKTVNVPKDYTTDKEIPVSANISWISCKEICIPGNKNIKSVIKPGISPGVNNTDLFNEWKNRLPVKKDKQFSYYTENKDSDGQRSYFEINIDFNDIPVEGIEWIPDAGQVLKIEEITHTLDPEKDKATVGFYASLYPGKMLSSPRIDSLLVIKDNNGNRDGYKIPVKVIEVLKKATKS